VFLQNMLKNTAQLGVSAPALRTVSSATAQGYLPQYRGSAAASLAPAMLNISNHERGGGLNSSKTEQQLHSPDSIVPLSAPSPLSENRPLNRGRSPQPIQSMNDGLDAEGYLRHLTQKAEQGWNTNATGSGPAMGPGW
jgi:hypothetical protein